MSDKRNIQLQIGEKPTYRCHGCNYTVIARASGLCWFCLNGHERIDLQTIYQAPDNRGEPKPSVDAPDPQEEHDATPPNPPAMKSLFEMETT